MTVWGPKHVYAQDHNLYYYYHHFGRHRRNKSWKNDKKTVWTITGISERAKMPISPFQLAKCSSMPDIVMINNTFRSFAIFSLVPWATFYSTCCLRANRDEYKTFQRKCRLNNIMIRLVQFCTRNQFINQQEST